MNKKEKKPKTPKSAGFIRTLVADNVIKLMDREWHGVERTKTGRQKALAKLAKTSPSTVQRVCNAETAGTLETLEQIAKALKVAVYQLMLPDLDVNQPPTIRGANERLDELRHQWEKGAKDEKRPTTRKKQAETA
jgi:transcriptional regulator with XRE-family HTH domain